MTANKRTSSWSLPGAQWVRPWVQVAEIAFSAPVVIVYRTARLATGGWPPSAQDRQEYTRMVQEKAQAFGQAAVAAVTTPPKDTAKVVGNALAPIRNQVVSNRKRLGP